MLTSDWRRWFKAKPATTEAANQKRGVVTTKHGNGEGPLKYSKYFETSKKILSLFSSKLLLENRFYQTSTQRFTKQTAECGGPAGEEPQIFMSNLWIISFHVEITGSV